MKNPISFLLMCTLVVLCAAMAPSPAVAQEDDETQILATLTVFFDGLTAKDSTAMLGVTDPGARLVLTSSRTDGTPLMRSIPIQEFVDLVVSRSDTAMEETFWDPEIQIHDNLATVWLKYNFYIEGELDHCGEDAFQLFRSEAGWRIIAIADTQRRQGCEPEEDRS